MLASEVIEQLQKLIEKYGDIEVVDGYNNTFADFEYNTDGDEPAFVTDLESRDE